MSKPNPHELTPAEAKAIRTLLKTELARIYLQRSKSAQDNMREAEVLESALTKVKDIR